MKKIIFYLTVLASVFYFNACNVNDYPEFNDADAFVAFSVERLSVEEDTGKVKIPVRLTSLAEMTSTVTFELKDSTAVSGRDYALSGGASVLTFDGSNPVQYIELDILDHLGEFTGDRLFAITITNATNVNIGGAKTIYITIADIDHPLSALLGTYTVNGPNYFSGRPTEWDITVEKDPNNDLSKVWISNFVVSGTNQKIYGIVNAEKNKIEIPVQQTIATSTSYTSIVLEGFDDPDVNKAGLMPAGSKLVMNMTSSSPVTFKIDYPFGSHIVDVGSWYSIVLGGATFTKK